MSLLLKSATMALLLASMPAISAGPAQGGQDESAAIPEDLGLLVVQANTGCELKINGDPRGILEGKQPREFPMKPGRVFVECSASADASDRAIESIRLGTRTEVKLRMPPPGRFTERAEGRHDAELGVIWTLASNEDDIDWPGAKRYCESKGAGWRLPTVAQLQSLWEAGLAPRHRFSGPCCLWSSEARTAESVHFVMLFGGVQSSVAPTFAKDMRALCVRRP